MCSYRFSLYRPILASTARDTRRRRVMHMQSAKKCYMRRLATSASLSLSRRPSLTERFSWKKCFTNLPLHTRTRRRRAVRDAHMEKRAAAAPAVAAAMMDESRRQRALACPIAASLYVFVSASASLLLLNLTYMYKHCAYTKRPPPPAAAARVAPSAVQCAHAR